METKTHSQVPNFIFLGKENGFKLLMKFLCYKIVRPDTSDMYSDTDLSHPFVLDNVPWEKCDEISLYPRDYILELNDFSENHRLVPKSIIDNSGEAYMDDEPLYVCTFCHITRMSELYTILASEQPLCFHSSQFTFYIRNNRMYFKKPVTSLEGFKLMSFLFSAFAECGLKLDDFQFDDLFKETKRTYIKVSKSIPKLQFRPMPSEPKPFPPISDVPTTQQITAHVTREAHKVEDLQTRTTFLNMLALIDQLQIELREKVSKPAPSPTSIKTFSAQPSLHVAYSLPASHIMSSTSSAHSAHLAPSELPSQFPNPSSFVPSTLPKSFQ